MQSFDCRHCEVVYVTEEFDVSLCGKYGPKGYSAPDADMRYWAIRGTKCPKCKRFEFRLAFHSHATSLEGMLNAEASGERQIYPTSSRRLPPEVPSDYRSDFDEAAAVLSISPRASAALSRRALQRLIRDKIGKKNTLADEITALLDSNMLPSSLRETVDMVRHLGNFGAHPVTDAAGVLLDVEEGEADLMLEILSDLFDFYFVEPVRRKARLDPIKAKIAAGGGKLKT